MFQNKIILLDERRVICWTPLFWLRHFSLCECLSNLSMTITVTCFLRIVMKFWNQRIWYKGFNVYVGILKIPVKFQNPHRVVGLFRSSGINVLGTSWNYQGEGEGLIIMKIGLYNFIELCLIQQKWSNIYIFISQPSNSNL